MSQDELARALSTLLFVVDESEHGEFWPDWLPVGTLREIASALGARLEFRLIADEGK